VDLVAWVEAEILASDHVGFDTDGRDVDDDAKRFRRPNQSNNEEASDFGIDA
jgi:hypothetical protein